MTRKQLIIIPGVGDDHWVYHVAARVFRLFGYQTHIRPFGWNQPDTSAYGSRLGDLRQFISVKTMDGPVYIIGVSAGGPVALSLLADCPDKVARIGMLCSPLKKFGYRVNPLLEVAITDAESKFIGLSEAQKLRILSIHGVADQVVNVKLSKLPGVRTAVLPTMVHAISIFLGLTVLSYPILRFFKQR